MQVEPKLYVQQGLWIRLINELRIRGAGERESGAFLLGSHQQNIITDFICFDDLDPEALDTGMIIFRSEYYTQLWQTCREKNMRVWADIHTHPRKWTGQSGLDESHPLISMKGHIAFIVPNYAQRKNQMLQGVGIYEYLGDYTWKTLTQEKNVIKWK